MKTIQVLGLVAFLVLTLSGCADMFRKPDTVATIIYVAPKDDLIIDCAIEPPPARDKYMSVSAKEREEMLGALNEKHYRNIFNCNDRFSQIRSWKKKIEAGNAQ